MFDVGIQIKDHEQLAFMRRAGLVVADIHDALREAVAPGVTTGQLDRVARGVIADHGASSNFLNYGAHGPDGAGDFSGVICTSVNDEVVHGVPGPRILRDGDVISLDCGAVVDGWHSDAAFTVGVGEIDAEIVRLIEITEEAMWRGIAATLVGSKVGAISHAIGTFVKSQRTLEGGRYGITEGFTGHGIGTEMHQPPNVPNDGRRGRGAKLVPGMVLAIEPMITLGSAQTTILEDEWTAVSVDSSWAAHVEHSVAITENGPWVLSARDGGAARLAAMGVPCGAPYA